MAVEISNRVSPEAKADIRELERKIGEFHNETIPEDKFKAYRLTRGVYGQRQSGVHMFRTKLPYGKITSEQLRRLAEISEKYATGNLHLTTRQNIQLHYVKLDDSPSVWTELSDVGLTAREACGNTVRNVTASAIAGIDPDEPFDTTPYAHATFQYFLRNPLNQDMGRKVKMAFSSSSLDSAFAYFHDFGFIPKVKNENGKEIRGFKVLVGGGLGAQSIIAPVAYDFLPEDQIIPFMEAALRVFDRYGERAKRFKARMKFLVKDLGLEAWMQLVDEERLSIKSKSFVVDRNLVPETKIPNKPVEVPADLQPNDQKQYEQWLRTNVFEQKQKGYYGVNLRVLKGDISHTKALQLADTIDKYAADDIRVTVNQGLLLRFVKKESFVALFNELDDLGFANPGFDTIQDITVCPGTDTCALGVTNSMGLAVVLEDILKKEYDHLSDERNIKIKMSGCMNACGQHMAAQIGFHGSSIKVGELVAPSMQIILGGGVDPDGTGQIGDKIIKLPTKRIPDALRTILEDYNERAVDGEYFNQYYRRIGKKHFYDLLKTLGDKSTFQPNEYQDWGQVENYTPEIGVGECAGVMVDLIGAIIKDADIKIADASNSLAQENYVNAIYESYTASIIAAKALLLSKDVACNTQIVIMKDFDEHFVESGLFSFGEKSFSETLLIMKHHEPTKEFATKYLNQAKEFLGKVANYRTEQQKKSLNIDDKSVIENYYKA